MGHGLHRFALPLPVRLRLLKGGSIFALELERDGTAEGETVSLRFLDMAGKRLARVEVGEPLSAVFIPQGAAAIAAESGPSLRIGIFPRSKLGLKLHAFFRGNFACQPLHRRWNTAAAAARDLRGIHATLLEGSLARREEQAVRYRRYRGMYVGDFATVTPPRPELRLTFLGHLGGAPVEAAARLSALQAQTDGEWEWIAILPPDADPELAGWARADLAKDPRIRLLEPSSRGAEALNDALAEVEDGLVAFLPPEGRPTRDAVAMIRAAFEAHPDCRVAYTDEERSNAQGIPVSGIFKPAFNRHLLRAGDYIGNIVAFRASYLKTLGGLRSGFGDAAHYDLLVRALEPLPPTAVRHIPRVAFSSPGGGPEGRFGSSIEAAAQALGETLGTQVDVAPGGRLRPRVRVPEPPPLVSIVIPTRDRADLMAVALRSLVAHTRYRNFEIVIVDNGSVEPATFALFEETKAAWPRTIVVRDDGSFNYPRICNNGVAASSGSVICLLNNDIEVVEAHGGWLDEMVGLVMQPRTGIVGAKLLFPDRTAQHLGVIVGLFRYAAHWFSHAAEDAPGPFGRLVCRTNLSAVTGACLVIRRNCWDTIGPLDAVRFAEDCNDIDLCLRARRAGFEVVWTPFACLIHHESASRGKRRSKAHRERLKQQRRRMEELWGTQAMVDPHYNPNLSRTSLHAALAAAPEGSRQPRTDEV